MKLRLLQWNCMYSEDPRKVAAFIRSVNPDIVCLQELTNGYHSQSRDTGQLIADALGYASFYKYGEMLLPEGGQTSMGVGIFSRFDLVDTQALAIETRMVEEGIVRSNDRWYLQAKVRLPNANPPPLTIGTMHLPFHPTFTSTPLVQSMVDSVLQCIPETDNYILSADLNKPPYSLVVKALRQGGLRHAGPALRYPTWTTKPFQIGDWSYDELHWRLDYVLFKGQLTQRRARVLQTELSDHLPLLLECEV